jgi:hypothetical protein
MSTSTGRLMGGVPERAVLRCRRAVVALLLAMTVTAAVDAAPAAADVRAPMRSCASLTGVDLSDVDAQVSTAADRTENGVLFCEVKGYLSPTTQFTVLLPQRTWLGNYLQQGCGGYCGHSEVNLDEPSRTSLHQAPVRAAAPGRVRRRRRRPGA